MWLLFVDIYIIHTPICRNLRRGWCVIGCVCFTSFRFFGFGVRRREKGKKGKRRRRNVAAVVGENWGAVVLHVQSRLTQLRVAVCLGMAVRRSQCDLMRCGMNNAQLFSVVSYPAILTLGGVQKETSCLRTVIMRQCLCFIWFIVPIWFVEKRGWKKCDLLATSV